MNGHVKRSERKEHAIKDFGEVLAANINAVGARKGGKPAQRTTKGSKKSRIWGTQVRSQHKQKRRNQGEEGDSRPQEEVK